MKKYFSKLLFLIILFSIFPAVSLAEVSKIEFVTDRQSIKPNISSEKITIQTQNSSGSAFQTPETLYLELTTSSATGEFSSNETSWKKTDSVTMSKNSANRSFYYKDSTEGTFTITVNVTGKEWTASQQITVASDASQNNDGEVLGVSSDTGSSRGSSLGESSLTNVSSLSAQLEVQAGNDRVTSPGSPIWFQATIKKNTTKTAVDLNWSFGDGNVGVGPLFSHTYKYPGDYVVVLSGKAGDIFSVSRLKVKVLESNISVLDKEEYLEIFNNDNVEINLFQWKLENKGKAFIFQPNTIILPKSSIKIDKNLLTMKGLDNSMNTVLKNAIGEVVFDTSFIETIDPKKISENIESIKNEVFVMQNKISNIKIKKEVVDLSKSELATSTENTNNIIYEVPKTASLVVRLTNFIKRVFSK